MFWKTFFSLKCSYGHVECSCNKPAKKTDKRQKTSAQCLKMIKNFICFPKFFLNKFSIDTENAVSRGRPNSFRWITGNDQKKVHKRFKKFSKIFSSESSHGEVESSLKAPLTFFGQPAEVFPLDIQKKVFKFCKRFLPESILWNWESSFDNSAGFFSENWSQKIA